MKKVKRIWLLMLSITVIIVIGVTQISTIFASDTVCVDDDNSELIANWSKVGSGAVSSVSQSDGTQYIKIDYDQSTTTTYYEYLRRFTAVTSGIIVFDTDIMFSNADEAIYVKSGSNIAVRIRNTGGWIYYYPSGTQTHMFMPDGETWTGVSTNTWYNIKIVVNLDKQTETIYIREKLTNKLIGSINNVALNKSVTSIDRFSIGASSTMWINHLKVYKPEIVDGIISGEQYVSKGGTYKYNLNGKSESGMAVESIYAAWSLNEEVEGISINESTGELTIEQTAPMVPIIITATSTDNSSIKASYLIDVE